MYRWKNPQHKYLLLSDGLCPMYAQCCCYRVSFRGFVNVHYSFSFNVSVKEGFIWMKSHLRSDSSSVRPLTPNSFSASSNMVFVSIIRPNWSGSDQLYRTILGENLDTPSIAHQNFYRVNNNNNNFLHTKWREESGQIPLRWRVWCMSCHFNTGCVIGMIKLSENRRSLTPVSAPHLSCYMTRRFHLLTLERLQYLELMDSSIAI